MSSELLRNPQIILQGLFREGGCGQVPEKLVAELSAVLHEIPLINGVRGDLVRDGALVRYRGMVQDQFDPEFYLKQFSVINRETGEKDMKCGMFQDITDMQPGFEIDFESSENITGDRQTLYVVPTPGESEWVRGGEEGTGSMEYGVMKGSSGDGGYGVSERFAKRMLEEEEDVEMDIDEDDKPSFTKKAKKGSEDITISSNIGSVSLNNPLPGETRFPCLVKVYNTDSQDYPINSLFEFIGIISSDPSLANFEAEPNGTSELVDPLGPESAQERKAHCPPPSLVPRLHCIKATPLHHSHPDIPISLTPPTTTDTIVSHNCDVKTSRQNLLDLFTTALLGDQLAAEFMLLHLLSSVFGRTEVMAIGKLSLNLSQCPNNTGNNCFPVLIHSLLSQLVTKIHFLPLTLSNLNTTNFTPCKDYEANRLQTGLLQLSAGTHLIVDETVMKPGQLGQKGVANIAALGSMVQTQRVKYDFKYHQQEFDCDLPVLILSEGKSLIKVGCHVPLGVSSSSRLQSNTRVPDPSSSLPDPSDLLAEYSDESIAQMRQYLVLCKLLKYSLDESVRKELQEDFVERRRVDPQMTAEVFHYLLNLSRLITISHGEESLSLSHWQHAKEMYNSQKQRQTATTTTVTTVGL